MNKNIIIAILSVLLITTNGYLAYDKLFIEKEQNNEIKIKETTIEEINSLDFSKISEYLEPEYSQEDLKQGTLKTIDSDPYYITLTLEGKVKICNLENCNYITNLANVTDMVKFLAPGAEPSEQQAYFLLENGDVYNYKFGNMDNNDFNATKVGQVSNVKRIINYSYISEEHSGIVVGLLAITKDNDYIQISQYK